MKPSLARYVQFLLKSIDRRVLRQGCGGEFRLQSRDRVTPGSSQCYASSKRHPHRPSQRKVRRGSRRRVTGAPHSFFLSADHSSLGEIGQFQVIQKNAQKFVAGKNKSECILLIVLGTHGAAGIFLAVFRAVYEIAFNIFAIAWQDYIATVAPHMLEIRLPRAFRRDRNFAGPFQVADGSISRGVANRALHHFLCAPQEALTIFKALASRIQAAIDNAHGSHHLPVVARVLFSAARHDQLACFTRMYHSTRRRTCRSV